MKLKQIRDDTRGATLVEFSVTFPFFLLLMFGLVQAGLLLYTQNGLQHAVEVAARCASVNYAANALNLNTSCFTVNGSPTPSTVVANNLNGNFTDITNYATNNSWGIPSSGFTVNPPPILKGTGQCGTDSSGNPIPGYAVSVSQPYNLINYIFSMTLAAKSCFPINGTS